MLIEKNAHNFWPLEKNYTLFEIQRTNIRSFCIDLIQLYDELKRTNDNSDETNCHYNLESADNINIFESRSKVKYIKFNSKDITYNERIQLKDWFIDYYQRYQDMIKGKEEKPSAFTGIPENTEGKLYSLDSYLKFFGEGYFAWMDFYVIRVGSQQYSFWSIER